MENETQINQEQHNTKVQQIQLPNSTGILVLGILSIVGFCCFAGLIGVVLGILAVILGTKAQKEYNQNPEKYLLNSYNNANAGKICGIIGLSLSGLFVVWFIIKLSIVGWALGAMFSTFPWETINF
ncbi:MAG: DUF4190 domain-containing protein [Salinivirgaceae bacterium]|nr:DUF4190 domain-containing protein [Salinivirgaceae bacterium]